ncbi:hypothetical protein CHU98_g12118 [Xylaria longipes]|nr:hypothetical protein CHU98_g12118 [Xylaria longipes]
MPPKKTPQPKENISIGPNAREGELVFGCCRIFASFNDTFIHVTDLSGRETITRVTGGMKVKADRDESSPYAAMLAAQDVAQRCKDLGINALHVKIRATGGNGTKTPGPGAQSALRALARSAPAERVVAVVVVCDRTISNPLSPIDLPFVWVGLWLGEFFRRSREDHAVSGTFGLELSPRLCGVDTYEENGVRLYEEKACLVSIAP